MRFNYIFIVSLLIIHLNIDIGNSTSNYNDNSLTLWNDMIHTTSSSSCGSGDQCVPGNTTMPHQCNYIKDCCGDTLGSALIDYLQMQYCFFNTVQPLGVGVLAVFVFYAFLILGNVADDYFAPIMAEMADYLGVSHELAGVTFVAFGNGAPDISSSVAAITQGGDTTKLGLGALLGAAVFDPIAVSGAIAVIVNNPKVARRPFLRDCFFLFIAAGCVLFITSDHQVTIAEAIGMVVIYVGYVGSVLLGEIYKKLRKKKRREAKKRAKSALKPPPETITDKMIMPALAAFSNDSMRDLFAQQNPKTVNKMPSIPQDSQKVINMPPQPVNRQLSRQESFLSRQESTEVPYIQDLYHQLEEEEAQKKKSSHRKSSDKPSKDDEASDSDSSASSFEEDDMSSESSDDEEDRAWWQSLLLYILRGPTLLVEILCKITIPLTDKNWNDYISICSCTTAPLFIQFAFASDSVTDTINGQVPIIAVVGLFGICMSLFTFWRVRRKYSLGAQQKELQDSLLGGDLTQTLEPEESIPTMFSKSDNANASIGANSSLSQMGGAYGGLNQSNGSLLHSSASIFSSQALGSSKSIQRMGSSKIGALKEDDEIDEDLEDVDVQNGNANQNGHTDDDMILNGDHKTKKKRKKRKKGDEEMVDLRKQPVMKFFFLILGFLSAVAWIELVANELVNLLTTLGVISTIDLALLGLTVLAWGNSIGDMIADVSVSKRGYAKMGISAAIGGPTLNVLIGVGLGTTINTLSAPDGKDQMPDTSNIFVCCIAVMLGILIYTIWTAITKWTLTRPFGYFCFVYYFGFIAINVLVYEGVIPLPFGK